MTFLILGLVMGGSADDDAIAALALAKAARSRPVETVPAAPAVAVARPFRVNYGNVRGHDCPGCGKEQTVQAGRGPERGTHWHVCADEQCKCQWYH